MSVRSQSVARVEQPEELLVPVLIAAVSAFTAALFVSEPFLFIVGMFVSLTFAALLRFDFFVYALVLLLPWCPLVDLNLPVRDVFLLLRFVLFVGVWIRLRRQNKSIHEWLFGNKLKKGVVLFAGIAIASVLLSGVPANIPSYRVLALLVSYLAAFFGINGWLEDITQLVRVLKLLLISTIGVALFGFYQAIVGRYTDFYFRLYPKHDEALEPWVGRITSFLVHFNSLAGYLNLVIPISMACAVFAKDRALKFLGLACACVAVVALFLTQSRGGLLALVGVLIIAVWLLVPRLIARITLLCVSALACILLLPPLLNHFERLQGVNDFTEVTRLLTWQAAATLFLDHPFLGVGYGNFRFLSSDLVPGAVPGTLDAHNLYLQLLAETGIVGFLTFAVLLGAFFVLSLKSMRVQDPLSRIVAFGVCGAIAATLIHGIVDYLFNVSPQFGALFWLVLGLGSCATIGASSKMMSETASR
jgi:putative inorganic carbon (HCO3(-)) transporter